MIIIAPPPLLFPENPIEGRDFPLYTPLLDDDDVLTTDFFGEQKQIFDFVIAFYCNSTTFINSSHLNNEYKTLKLLKSATESQNI